MYAEWARALATGSSELLISVEDEMRVVDIARTATEEAMQHRVSKR